MIHHVLNAQLQEQLIVQAVQLEAFYYCHLALRLVEFLAILVIILIQLYINV